MYFMVEKWNVGQQQQQSAREEARRKKIELGMAQ
jgi:hypothetical protein